MNKCKHLSVLSLLITGSILASSTSFATNSRDPFGENADVEKQAEEILKKEADIKPAGNVLYDGLLSAFDEIEKEWANRDTREPLPELKIEKKSLLESVPLPAQAKQNLLRLPLDPPLIAPKSDAEKKLQKAITPNVEFTQTISDLSSKSHFSIHAKNSNVQVVVYTGGSDIRISAMLEAESKGVLQWITRPDQDGQELRIMAPANNTSSTLKIEIPDSLLSDLRIETDKGNISLLGKSDNGSALNSNRMIRLVSENEGSITVKNISAEKGLKISNLNKLADLSKPKTGVLLGNVSGAIRAEIGDMGLVGTGLSGSMLLLSNGGSATILKSKLPIKIQGQSSQETGKKPSITLEGLDGVLKIAVPGNISIKQSNGSHFDLFSEDSISLIKNESDIVARALNEIQVDQNTGTCELQSIKGNIKVSAHDGTVYALSLKGKVESDSPVKELSKSMMGKGEISSECEAKLVRSDLNKIVLNSTVRF